MDRDVPSNLLTVLETWSSKCNTCVKWNTVTSHTFNINFGVRQGSVLSPTLFAIYVNDIASKLTFGHKYAIILYADDILLLSPSISELQVSLKYCETELTWLDMSINTKKSCCLRIGPRSSITCANLVTANGTALPWVSELRYLGVYIVS